MSGFVGISPWRLIANTAQKLTTGAASVTSTAFQPTTRAILVAVTQDAHIRIDAAGDAAVATDMLIKAAWPPIVIGVGGAEKLSVIEDATGGLLYLQELSR